MRLVGFVLLLLCGWSAGAAAQSPVDLERSANSIARLCAGGGRTAAVNYGDTFSVSYYDTDGNVKGAYTIPLYDLGSFWSRLRAPTIGQLDRASSARMKTCFDPIVALLLYIRPDLVVPNYGSFEAPGAGEAQQEYEAVEPYIPLPFRRFAYSHCIFVTAGIYCGAPHLSEIDEILSKLVKGNVAFAAPDRATIGKSRTVEARLSVTKTPTALINELTGAGKKETASLKVSDKMTATLNGGSAFDVSPSGPQVQLISRTDTTIWTWTITPKLSGTQILLLSLDALLSIDGKDGSRTVNTLTKEIDVEVAWPETFDDWITYVKNLFDDLNWLWVTILVPLAALGLRYRKKKQNPDEVPAPTPSVAKRRRRSERRSRNS